MDLVIPLKDGAHEYIMKLNEDMRKLDALITTIRRDFEVENTWRDNILEYLHKWKTEVDKRIDDVVTSSFHEQYKRV